MVRQCIRTEVLLRKDYFNPIRRKKEKGLFVDPDKRPDYDQ
jgi:hypothetical protein